MARPKKQGLDYFPLDVDFFNDEKIICIAGEFGMTGEIVALKLLTAIYRNGYYIEWSDATAYKLKHDLQGVDVDLLTSIVERLAFWGFFDKKLFDEEKILTSRGIQTRYFEATKRRQSNVDLPYILVNVAKTTPNSGINVDNNSANDELLSAKSTQSKVKESKVKKKINPPLTPPVGEDARQGAERGKEFLKIFLEREPPERMDKQMKAMRLDRDHFEHIARMVVDEWDDFGDSHSSYGAAVKHLYNHVRKKLRDSPELRTAKTRQQAERQQAERAAERAKRDEELRSYRQSVDETGMNGWQQWCAARGLDPTKTSAKEIAPTS